MNAVIYARYSSYGQSEQSIEGQLRDCYTYAEREGYAVVGEYIDRALTGRFDNRPDFQRMISDAPKKQFQIVIVWKLDRFARNRYDSAIYKARLKKHGVRVISATENISDEPEGIILEGMLESMAEYYSANLSKHVKRGMRESVIKGTYTGGMPPIGYKVVDKKLVIDEEKAPIIRYAFEQYAKGIPKKQIIDDLSARGIRNGAGKPLTATSFQSALHNKKYIGIYELAGEPVTGGCPALIDEETFYTVQQKLAEMKRAPAKAKAKQEYLLSGKAFCGMCGSRLIGESGTGKLGTIYHYYTCALRKKNRSCKKLNEKKDFLAWYVVEQTVKYILAPERMSYIAERIVATYDSEFNGSRTSELERRLAKLDSDINKAVDASIEAPAKARKIYYEKIEALETQKADIEIDLSRLKIASGIKYTKEQIVTWLKTFCNGDPLDEAFQRRIIDVFINTVFLYDNKLIMFYNIKDGKQISYIEMLESTEEPPFGGDPDSCNGVRISNEPPCQLKSQ